MMLSLQAGEPRAARVELAQGRQRQIESEKLVQKTEQVARENAALAQKK